MRPLPLASGGLAPSSFWGPPFPPPPEVYRLAQLMRQWGGQLLVVGGWVRDGLVGLPPGDVDLEVFGLHPRQVLTRLGARAHVVGNHFGIIKVGHLDLSFPRALRRPGGGEEALLEDTDPDLPLVEACRRRDFTANSLVWDPLTSALYDPFGGFADILSHTLRHVDPESLVEDPLRSLRAARFVARFGWEVAPDTLALLKTVVTRLPSLPRERPGDELKKLLTGGNFQRQAWAVLWDLGVVQTLWPELGTREDRRWQNIQVALAHLGDGPEDKEWHRVLATAVLLHGKEEAVVLAFLERVFGGEHLLLERVPALLKAYAQLPVCAEENATDGQIRRLALISPMRWVVKLWEVLNGNAEPGRRLEVRAQGLGVWEQGPRPLVLGRDLLGEGMTPGPTLGQVLKVVFEAQLDGAFVDREGGIRWWRRQRDEAGP